MKKGVLRVSVLVVVVGMLGFAPCAMALTVNGHTWEAADFITAGDGLLTVDSATGLEWLDVTRTQGESFDQVAQRLLNPLDELYGFRYATATDLHQMFGVFDTGDQPASGPVDEAEALVRLLGATGEQSYGVWVYGWYDDSEDGSDPNFIGLAHIFVGVGFWRGVVKADGGWFPGVPNPQEGSWLVRVPSGPASVPEPGSLLLVGMGLVGLLALRRKYHRKP